MKEFLPTLESFCAATGMRLTALLRLAGVERTGVWFWRRGRLPEARTALLVAGALVRLEAEARRTRAGLLEMLDREGKA